MLSADDPRPTRWLVVRGELLAQVAAGVHQAARAPRRSTLRDSIPDAPPPEVLRALRPLTSGGQREMGAVDQQGQRWTHQPWQGWRPAPSPYLRGRGRVYKARAVRRARRRALLVRWAAGPGLAVAGVLVCAGLVNLTVVWALAGIAVAAVVLGMAWSVGRP